MKYISKLVLIGVIFGLYSCDFDPLTDEDLLSVNDANQEAFVRFDINVDDETLLPEGGVQGEQNVASLEIELPTNVYSNVTVTYSITSDGAVEGVDYAVLSGNYSNGTGTITIDYDFENVGFDAENLEIASLFDGIVDETKTLTVTLVSAVTADGQSLEVGQGSLHRTKTITLVNVDCPDFSGTYNVTSDYCEGNGAGGCATSYTGESYAVTFTKVSPGVYEISDITGGLYVTKYEAADNPIFINESECGTLTFSNQPDVVFGGDAFSGSGTMTDDGTTKTIVITWTNGWGDQGTSTLVSQ